MYHLVVSLLLSHALAAPLSGPEMVQRLKVVDDRQQNNGDYRSVVFLEQKEKGKSDLVYQLVVYRRDVNDKLAMMFLKPQAEAGKGYLRADKNLFFYDPSVGKWERRTERERIGGTNSQRADFDQSRLAEAYTPAWVGDETLGAHPVEHLKLTLKEGMDEAYPVIEVWLDTATGNTLKIQNFALSGRLMRTAYYPEWQRKFSQSKGTDVYFPKKILIYDEIEKGNSTTITIQEVDLAALEDSIFTKAWIEARSR